MSTVFKISVSVPKSHSEKLMDAIDNVNFNQYDNYRRAFSIIEGKGTWIPLKNSNPHIGKINEVSIVDEIILSFITREENLKQVLNAIKETHPYEEPAIDVIECKDWKSYL